MQRRQSREPRRFRPEQIEWATRTRPSRVASTPVREKSTTDPQGVNIRPTPRRRPRR